jgi:lambda family phage portal protein
MRVPAEQILHNYLVTRPGQVRGIPWYAPVLADLMHLAKYREAEVIAARTAAAKMGFIKGGSGESETIELVPGSFPKLGQDEEVQFFDPNHPNGNYDAFDRAIMRSVASAFRVSYMSLSGDLSQTSFASGQMGYMSEKNMYRTLQERRILRYSRPVHKAWLSMAIVSGQLDVRGALGDLLRCDWRARPFYPIDPLKAANTDAINLALGKTCLTDLVEADGGDLRRVLQKRADEIKLAESLGVPLYLPVGNAISVTESATDDAEDRDTDTDRTARTPALKRVS